MRKNPGKDVVLRHLRQFISIKLGIAIPTAGTGVLTSCVALAGVLWVSVSTPNVGMLRALTGGDTTSVAISLQSALLGIDDGNGRDLVHEKGLARALGLTDMFFVNMQAHYDAEIAREHLAKRLASIERIA